LRIEAPNSRRSATRRRYTRADDRRALREPSGDRGRKGAEIAVVEPASPVDAAGLEKGAEIAAVDGRPVETPSQLWNFIGSLLVGREIGIRY
jgi:S1-C subfamily serine protease